MSDDCVYYYFAYGSNLLSYRIAESVSNPRFMCRGILKVNFIIFFLANYVNKNFISRIISFCFLDL